MRATSDNRDKFGILVISLNLGRQTYPISDAPKTTTDTKNLQTQRPKSAATISRPLEFQALTHFRPWGSPDDPPQRSQRFINRVCIWKHANHIGLEYHNIGSVSVACCSDSSHCLRKVVFGTHSILIRFGSYGSFSSFLFHIASVLVGSLFEHLSTASVSLSLRTSLREGAFGATCREVRTAPHLKSDPGPAYS